MRKTSVLKKLIFTVGVLLISAGSANAMETVKAVLTSAPNVPPPIERTSPAKVIIELETVEFRGRLAEDVEYDFWSFGGTVPGPFMRVRVGDDVEFHLKNRKDSKNKHNIDIHAVNGPGGGAGAMPELVDSGEEKVFQWKAVQPGLYIYHCASPHIPTHIANGMYGLLLVEPAEGLPPVDKEFYVVRSEFYTKGKTGEPGFQEFSEDKGYAEQPEYVVFNGSADALAGDITLNAKAGETVRIFAGNAGPNQIWSFHVIGEIFDTVYSEGGIGGVPSRNIQTTTIPSAGAAIVDFKVEVPGTYLLVDHSIFRIDKGAVGLLKVSGKDQPDIFKKIK